MMITELFLTGAAATLGGALATRAGRDLFLGKVDHDWLADELELDCIEPDGVTVRMKGGTRFRVFALRGASYDAKVANEQEQMLLTRAALFHALGELGCAVYLYGVKRQRDISFTAKWPSPALQEIGDAESGQFKTSYFINWFLVIAAKSAKPLLEGGSKINAMGKAYRPEPVERQGDGENPCPLTGFLNFLVSGDLRRDLPSISENLSGSLPAADLDISKDGVIVTRAPRTKYHQVIAIRAWPETVDGRTLGHIMSISGDVEVSQICIPDDREKSLALLNRASRAQQTALIGNPTLAAEYSALATLLTEGNTTVFNAQLQIIVRADTEEELDGTVWAISEILGSRRIIYSIETEGAPVCWFNRIPFDTSGKISPASKLLRPLSLREQNIAAIWAFNHSPTGMMSGPQGPMPIRMFATPTGQAYGLQFHLSDDPKKKPPGNYLVFGGTGGGKTTLMMHILGGLAKFAGYRTYIFDSKEGARFMIEAMGGLYQSYDEMQLNPLDVGEDTPTNRHRVYMVLKAMTGDLKLTPEDEAALNHAVELAFTMEPPHRTLNAIFEFAFEKRTTLRSAFQRFVTDEKGRAGLDAHIFNAPHDGLGGLLTASHMIGMNMNEALDDPIKGPPIVSHIATAILSTAPKVARGFNIFIDEGAKLLQNEGFEDLAMEMYREIRKLRGNVGIAFQDPKALLRSRACDAVLENTTTMLFFPNAKAKRENLEPFGLNEEHIEFVLAGADGQIGAGKRHVLIVKKDAATGYEESAILDVDLTPLGEALRFYDSGPDANQRISELKKQWGEEWLTHL